MEDVDIRRRNFLHLIKFEGAQTDFFGDVLTAVVVVVA